MDLLEADRQSNEQSNTKINEQLNKKSNEQLNEQINEQTNEQSNPKINYLIKNLINQIVNHNRYGIIISLIENPLIQYLNGSMKIKDHMIKVMDSSKHREYIPIIRGLSKDEPFEYQMFLKPFPEDNSIENHTYIYTTEFKYLHSYNDFDIYQIKFIHYSVNITHISLALVKKNNDIKLGEIYNYLFHHYNEIEHLFWW
jgi:hypothetical protein